MVDNQNLEETSCVYFGVYRFVQRATERTKSAAHDSAAAARKERKQCNSTDGKDKTLARKPETMDDDNEAGRTQKIAQNCKTAHHQFFATKRRERETNAFLPLLRVDDDSR